MGKGTRDRILDASLRLFAGRGVDGTHVTDIEAESGLSPGSGSFYRHFRSKEDVLDAVVEREIDRVRERRESGPPPDAVSQGDPRVSLAVEFTESLEGLERMRHLIALLGRERDRMPDLAPRINEVMMEGGLRWSAERIQSRMQAGQIPSRDAEGLASVIMSSLVGYHLANQFFRSAPSHVDRARFVSALVDAVAPASD
ncbi:MAG: TetR/AcrR family transcriptional regulator [Myxococcota bacterium]